MKLLKSITAAAAAFMVVATAADASVFRLGDHPDGNQQAQYDYGLRLDGPGLFFTFDQANGSNVFLEVSGTTATISGTVRQSVNVPAPDTTLGTDWTIEYTLTDIQLQDGLDDFKAFRTALVANGSGFITDGSSYYALTGKAPGNDYSKATFEFDDDGHRLPSNDDWVGRGWVFTASCNANGEDCEDPTYTSAQDFLFTATVVPLPAAAWFLIGGIGALGAVRARRKAT